MPDPKLSGSLAPLMFKHKGDTRFTMEAVSIFRQSSMHNYEEKCMKLNHKVSFDSGPQEQDFIIQANSASTGESTNSTVNDKACISESPMRKLR